MDWAKYLVGLMMLSALSACGKSDSETKIEQFSAERDAENKSAREAFKNHSAPYDKLPEVPVTTCPGDECDTNSLEMIKAWPKAWAGDYGAQRNVAYMQSTSTPGVASNPVQGCAWRIVIQASGHVEFTPGDQSNFDTECGRISASEFDAAKAVAGTIFEKIKHSKMPSIAKPKRD